MNRKQFALVLALPTAFFAWQSVASAESVTLTATLSGAMEVPPVTTDGKGTATFTVDTAAKTVTYEVTYSGLSDVAKMAHIHGPAAVGANAGVVVPLTIGDSPLKGTVTLTDTQIADLLAGKDYVNIHTGTHPSGEIRGYINK